MSRWQDLKRRQAEREQEMSCERENRERAEKERREEEEQRQQQRRLMLKVVGFVCLSAAVSLIVIKVYRGAVKPQLDAQDRINAARASYDPGRVCTTEREDVDYLDMAAGELSHGSFTYQPAKGCWAKIVLPKLSDHWYVQTAAPERETDWFAIGCIGGRVLLGPISPNTTQGYGTCGDRSPRDRHTYLIQGNTTLMWVAKDIPAEANGPAGIHKGQVTSQGTVREQDTGVPPPPKPHDFRDDYHDRLCASAVGKDAEVHIDPKEDRYTVTLKPGCFSALIYVPKEWERWSVNMAGDGWAAFTYGDRKVYATKAEDIHSSLGVVYMTWDANTSRLRVQGDGSFTVYQAR